MDHQFSKAKMFVIGIAAVSFMLFGGMATGNSAASAIAAPNEIAAMQTTLLGKMTVFRSPTCGCCGDWVEHVETAGFEIEDNITEDMDAIKQQYGIPDHLTSCHTAIVGGYIVEGHVPAEDVTRLLAEAPNVIGITAPGMPTGSPGMESDDGYTEPYTVYSFTESGEMAAFAEHS